MYQSLTKLTSWDRQRPCLCCIGNRQWRITSVHVVCMAICTRVSVGNTQNTCPFPFSQSASIIFSPHTHINLMYILVTTHTFVNAFMTFICDLCSQAQRKMKKKKSYEKEKNWKGTATYVFANLNITYIKKGYSMLIYVNIGKNEMYTCTSQHNTHLHKYIFFLHVLMYIYTSMFMYVCIQMCLNRNDKHIYIYI